MSVDSAIEAASGEPDATPNPITDPDASFLALFSPRSRLEAEPGVWSLLLVPVLVCVAMVIFVSVTG